MVNGKRIKLITGCDINFSKYVSPREEFYNYSKKWGFKFEFKEYGKNPKQDKLKHIYTSLCEDYDYVIWMDYDIRVLNYDHNIMDQVKDDKSIYVASHLLQSDDKWKNRFNLFEKFKVENTGVMVFKSDDFSKEIIREMRNLIRLFYDNYRLVDNGAFLNVIGKSKLLDKLYKGHKPCVRGDSFYGCLIGELPNNFNYCRYFNYKVDKEMPIIFEHYAGVKDREEYLL